MTVHAMAQFDGLRTVGFPPVGGRGGACVSLEVVDAILAERLVAVSDWSGGKLRIGSLQETAAVMEPLPVSKFQHLRVRSRRGTFDYDKTLLDCA